MAERSKWTVLTYIAAHNNLARLGKRSLMDIVDVGSSDAVVHGALYDHPDGVGRYVMGDVGSFPEQQRLATFDSGDPEALIDTARWLFGKHPAERYALVLWSHGTGWEPAEIARVAGEARPGAGQDLAESRERSAMPGSRSIFRTTLRAMQKPAHAAERAILFDDGTGHSLDTIELARVADTIAAAVGQPLDLVGMDACLMASLEVGYELRQSVRHFVASEEMVPGHSWPYAAISGELRARPELGGDDLAKLVVDRYLDCYTAAPPPAGDVTKVAVDLGRVEGLAAATGGLARALLSDMARHAPALWAAQHAALDHETRGGKRTPSKFDYHLWDLGAVAAGLSASADATPDVQRAAAATLHALAPGAGPILAEGHRGAWFDGTAGVSVYLMPPGRQRLSPAYSALAFARDARWHEMLSGYHDQLS